MAQLIKRPWTKGDPSNLRCAKCIGTIGDKKNVCKFCSFTFCNECFNESYCYLCVPYNLSFIICYECNEFINDFNSFNIKYCRYCDCVFCINCIPKINMRNLLEISDPITGEHRIRLIPKCKSCYRDNISRNSLPHYKAKSIIIEYFIPVIAEIIYDYYYIPRRYDWFEM